MTREQLDAIRARYADEPLIGEMRTDRFGNLITVTREHPVVALLAEVERLTALTEAINPCRLIDVGDDGVSRKRAEADAFKRGVAAMREAAAKRCEVSPFFDKVTTVGLEYADAVRALPDPEDKS